MVCELYFNNTVFKKPDIKEDEQYDSIYMKFWSETRISEAGELGWGAPWEEALGECRCDKEFCSCTVQHSSHMWLFNFITFLKIKLKVDFLSHIHISNTQ